MLTPGVYNYRPKGQFEAVRVRANMIFDIAQWLGAEVRLREADPQNVGEAKPVIFVKTQDQEVVVGDGDWIIRFAGRLYRASNQDFQDDYKIYEP